MISGYSVNGKLGLAQSVFEAMPMKDFVSWSAIIAGYVQNGELKGGVELFKEMLRERVCLSKHVYASVFKACAGLCDLRLGSARTCSEEWFWTCAWISKQNFVP